MKKFMTQWSIRFSLLAVLAFLFAACSSDKNNSSSKQGNGIYIECQGNWSTNDGSVDYFDPTTMSVTSDVFNKANGVGLGDIVQSMSIYGGKGYIVVNNSQKVEIVDMSTFKRIHTITGLSYPRYVLNVSADEFMVSNGNSQDYSNGQVYVYDANTYAQKAVITVGKGPEQMAYANGKVFVTNSGGYKSDKTVSIIDPNMNIVTNTITVGDDPCDIAVDANQDVWVYCKGLGTYDAGGPTNAFLYKINSATNVVEKYDFKQQVPSYGTSLIAMSANGKYLYYCNGGIFKLDVNATTLPATALVPLSTGDPFGLEVDPKTGDIIALYGKSSTQGTMTFYSSTSGAQIDTYKTGSYPSGAAFYY
jgi:YVTN family beta-propeller protein